MSKRKTRVLGRRKVRQAEKASGTQPSRDTMLGKAAKRGWGDGKAK